MIVLLLFVLIALEDARLAYFYTLACAITIFFIVLLFFTSLDIYFYGFDKVLSLNQHVLNNILGVAIVFGLFIFIVFFIDIKDSLKTKVRIAEQIFKTLTRSSAQL